MIHLLRAFLVDDEQLALNRLARLLEKTGRVEIAGMTTDPAVAVERLGAEPFDVVFTDIQMPALSGFDVLTKLDPQPLVVFTTAFSEYALQAFEVNSVDYLLKPVEEKQLERALNKLERILGGTEPKPRIETLLQQLASAIPDRRAFPSRLPSRCGERIEFVDIGRVTHFYANEKLTYAATPKKEYIVDYTITELENKLDPARFVRIHRSTIVNLEFVKELHSWFSERLMLRINDGKDTELTVSRDRVKQLKEKLGL
ncbi:MAG: response regulator transcription factor [Acidobacteriaceae bacterium]|nr:response regulator transcription factor [Acidobacteriaceae bacterium]